MRLLALAAMLAAPTGALAQVAFAPAGARAVLTVEYAYKSEGRVADKYDSREWRVLRSASLTSELAAARPTELSSVNAPDAAQAAKTQRAVAQGEAIAAHLGTSAAGLQAAAEKCGDDEACLQKFAMQLAATGAARPKEQTQRLARETGEALKPGALRYQLWKATLQKGSYSVSEDVRIVHADPICMSLPGARCHRSEERRGSGALVPAGSRPIDLAGFAHAELDAQKNTLSLRLPIPLGMLPYTETIVTDEPKGTHDHEPPRGPVRRELDFRALRDIAPFTVPLQGGWKSQSGEFSVKLEGERDEGGTLAVRWRFVAP